MSLPRVVLALGVVCLLFSISNALKYQNSFEKSQYSYTTGYFKQVVDHFSFTNNDGFEMRYLFNKDHWKPGMPIYFYAGNEGDITLFLENTGNMWDIAQEYGGMILFAEHRYYGESIPYGSKTKPTSNPAYLTSEQALADYAVFLTSVRDTWAGAEGSPVVVFGGSYGGMLAAWMRIKYPHLVVGAIAASAPIWQFQGVTPCTAYNQIVTKSFARYGATCTEAITNSWGTIDQLASTAEGMSFLTSAFHTCSPIASQANVTTLKAWLTNAWSNIAMVEYPYPSSFLAPLPAWPIKSVCAPLATPEMSGRVLVNAIYEAVSVYYNYSGQVPHCFDINPGSGSKLGDQGWDYQACTEMIMPMCSQTGDMFENSPWNLDTYLQNCKATYGVNGRPYWIMTNYLGKTLNQTSNIVFSNGLLDPWHGGGVLTSVSDTVVAVLIKDGAHHLDLRSANPADPQSVKDARKLEREHMVRWINEYYSSKRN